MHLSIALALLTTSVSAAIVGPLCTKPVVRKEWRDLSKEEQKAYIDALKCLGNLPGSTSFYATGINNATIVPPVKIRSLYDDFVYSHMDGVPKTHFVGQDLWWHRMYLTMFENTLREKCGYKFGVPYWDWSQDVADLSKAPVFNSDPTYGLGTWGTAASNWTVTDGAFANVTRVYPKPHIIKRRYQPQPFEYNGVYPFDFDQPKMYAGDPITPAKIQAMVTGFKGDPVGFQSAFEGHLCQGPHNAVHMLFGTSVGPLGEAGAGDMSDANHPPNDPVFFLHHANVDRIWQKWKENYILNTFAIGGGTVQAVDQFPTHPQGLAPNVSYNQILETNGLGPKDMSLYNFLLTFQGFACYVYQQPLSSTSKET